jgi:hypothetical protein
MNDQTTVSADDDFVSDLPKPDELATLKERANVMGIKFSPNIGAEALRQRIKEHLEGTSSAEEEKAGEAVDGAQAEAPLTKSQIRAKMIKEEMRQIRIRISCLNPDKAALQGEILCVANKYLGEVKKFIPFGEATDDGYHVPYILYKLLKSRKFLHVKTSRNRQTGQIDVTQRWVPEFAIEVLPQLTKEELKDLAAAQAAAGGVN